MPKSFYELLKNSKKILVLDLGFLGDTVHLFPSIRLLRDHMPCARIDVMVASHIQSVMELLPWIDEVTGYPRYPKGPKWYEDYGRIRDAAKQPSARPVSSRG